MNAELFIQIFRSKMLEEEIAELESKERQFGTIYFAGLIP
jgi:hypothetical protein